jgi:3-oxo-5-alpha-steroid 4-dehydrogenase 1
MVPAFARELGVNNLRLPILPAGTPPHLPGTSIKEEILTITQFTAGQWLTDFYPQGKTSVDSRFNLPGKWAWAGMECVGFITVLYCMFTIPDQLGLDSLPWGNWTMAGVYTIHYVYRALIFPWAQPTMSPIHISVFLAATAWNIINGLSIGGYVAGYGPQTAADWGGRLYNIEIGLVVWGWGLLANMFHDDDLREIRRSTMRRRKEQAAKDGKPVESVDKLYMLPKNGLFHYVLYYRRLEVRAGEELFAQ